MTCSYLRKLTLENFTGTTEVSAEQKLLGSAGQCPGRFWGILEKVHAVSVAACSLRIDTK